MRKNLTELVSIAALSFATAFHPLQSQAAHVVYDCTKDVPTAVRSLSYYEKIGQRFETDIIWVLRYHRNVSPDYIKCMQENIPKKTFGKYTFVKVTEDDQWVYYGFKKASETKS